MALFKHFFKDRNCLSFVQVGANDGIKSDFLHERIVKYHWRGVLVEPIPHIFEQLKKNYADCDGLAFENVAIAEAPGERDFYVCDGHEVCSGLELINPKDRGRKFTKTTVPCITIDVLFVGHGIETLDILVIDTEGYDGRIIKTMDFRVKPKVLIYESKGLPDNDEVKQILKSQGYRFRPFSSNTVAYL